jgi:hypothetical protein
MHLRMSKIRSDFGKKGMHICILIHLSLLKNLSALGIGLPMKIATRDFLNIGRRCDLGTMHGFWAPLHPTDTVVKRNGPHAETLGATGWRCESVSNARGWVTSLDMTSIVITVPIGAS